MNVKSDARPTRHYSHPRVSTDGDLAAEFCTAYGLTPDPWQRLVLDDWLAYRSGGVMLWANLTCGLSVPRQNGKNALVEMRELYGAVGLNEKILHTAHELKTAMKAFKRLLYFFGEKPNDPDARFPELNARVKSVRNVNGQEAVFLKDKITYNAKGEKVVTPGGSIEISARSKSAARGFTVDVVIFDEAQEMSEADLEALLPTTSSAPQGNPQWIFIGTPPGPRAAGEVFTRTRSEIKESKGRLACWHEWGAEAGWDLDDPNVWRRTNPALCHRLSMDVIEAERARFSDEGFLRERLGGWSAAVSMRVISPDAWNLARDIESIAVDRFALAIDVAPDMVSSSVAIAGQRDDGDWHIDIGAQQAGHDWVVPWVKKFLDGNPQVRNVVIDVAGPAATLVDEIAKNKIRVISPAVREVGVGCSNFLSGINKSTVWHLGDYRLTHAVDAGRKRSLAATGLWAWNRKDQDADITPLVAATLALWGAQQTSATKQFTRTNRVRRAVVL